MRRMFVNAFVAMAIATAVAFGADNSLGTWKLNVEKSTYTPGPMPVKNLTITRDAAEGGMKQTISGERADGTAIEANFTAKYDGKEVSVSGNAPYNTIAIKQENANTFTDSRKKTGTSYVATGRTVVSNNGKTLTTTTKGTDSDGKEFTSVLVFEKQ